MIIQDPNLALVTIIIPVYKTEKYLEKCLNSVSIQTYRNFEAIVIDDGSPDNAYLIAEAFCCRDQRFKFLRQENMGLSGARNTGIKHANGKYMLFLDSDDALTSGAIDGLVTLAENENSDIVIPDQYFKIIESTGKKTLERHFTKKEYISNPIEFGLEVLIGKGRAWRSTSVLYLTEIIQLNNILFPVGYTAEDIVFNLLFLSYAKKITHYDLPTLFNLKRADSITTSYDENQLKKFLYIDNQVLEFLRRNKIKYNIGENYRNLLLKRNIIIAITSIMSAQNNEPIKIKIENAERILMNQRVAEAFNCKLKFSPFFNSQKVVLYFKIMNFILTKRFKYLALILAFLVGKKSVII